MKSKSKNHKKNEYLMLVHFYSEQQWGQFYSLRLFHGKDKLNCYLSAWDDYCLDNIEHEFDDDFFVRREEVLENLRKGIDHDVEQLEFDTEWDGYDSYSLKILAAGYIDTFLGKAIEETLSSLQSINEEKNLEYDDGDQDQINKFSFVVGKIQKLKELIANNKTSFESKLRKLEKYVIEIDEWLEANVNSS
jgi:hypothetical protein